MYFYPYTVRYQGKSDMEENFLFCRPLETTTGEGVIKLVDSFIKVQGLSWEQCFSVCVDGAPAMLGHVKASLLG